MAAPKPLRSMTAAPIPCWPASNLETALTKFASWRIGWAAVIGSPIFIVLTGHALRLASGLPSPETKLVNPFVAYQFDVLVSHKITDVASIFEFKLFEVSVHISLIYMLARLAAGFIFMRQYDQYYLSAKRIGWTYVSLIFRLLLGGVAGIFCAFSAAVPATIPSIAFLAKRHPAFFALLDGILFAGGSWFLAESLLMTAWVLLRKREAEHLLGTL